MGFFSWNCKCCGKSIVSPYSPKEIDWMNKITMVLETGEAIVSEGLGTGSLVSFVPLGHTFRTINKIAFQDTYKISYYLLDESADSDEQDRQILHLDFLQPMF